MPCFRCEFFCKVLEKPLAQKAAEKGLSSCRNKKSLCTEGIMRIPAVGGQTPWLWLALKCQSSTPNPELPAFTRQDLSAHIVLDQPGAVCFLYSFGWEDSYPWPFKCTFSPQKNLGCTSLQNSFTYKTLTYKTLSVK